MRAPECVMVKVKVSSLVIVDQIANLSCLGFLILGRCLEIVRVLYIFEFVWVCGLDEVELVMVSRGNVKIEKKTYPGDSLYCAFDGIHSL